MLHYRISTTHVVCGLSFASLEDIDHPHQWTSDLTTFRGRDVSKRCLLCTAVVVAMEAEETRTYVIRERVKLTKRQQSELQYIVMSCGDNPKRLEKRLALVLEKKGLTKRCQNFGPRGGVTYYDVLTPAGEKMVDRINDECEGVDSDGRLIVLVDTLPEGYVYGERCDANGKRLLDVTHTQAFILEEMRKGAFVIFEDSHSVATLIHEISEMQVRHTPAKLLLTDGSVDSDGHITARGLQNLKWKNERTFPTMQSDESPLYPKDEVADSDDIDE